MRRRPYESGDDIARLQDFTARQIQRHGRIGLVHPGDIPHRIFNGLRRDDPHELVHIWEDDAGEVVAWTLLDPRGGGFDPQIAPGARDLHPGLEKELLVWSEETLFRLMQQRESTAPFIETDAFADDSRRIQMLHRLGWVAQDVEILWLTRRPLVDAPQPDLPAGYRVRSVRGVAEAGPVAELHSAGFGSSWTPELYRRVMESPGYDPQRELLVVAPDGSLAGFCVTWPDPINRVGYFEPVAVHPDHRRRGVGKTLMRAGMQLMKTWGMEWAEVMYEESNPGSGRLYRGEGFTDIYRVVLYRKPVNLGS